MNARQRRVLRRKEHLLFLKRISEIANRGPSFETPKMFLDGFEYDEWLKLPSKVYAPVRYEPLVNSYAEQEASQSARVYDEMIFETVKLEPFVSQPAESKLDTTS